jgi:hypothetical protein
MEFLQPRIKLIFTNGERLCRRVSLFASFVFVEEIGGSNIQRMEVRAGWGHLFCPADRVFEALA